MPVHGGQDRGNVHAGSFERDDPRRGGLSPRARRTSPGGGVLSPQVRRVLLVGASNPQARRTPPEGASTVPPWRAAGATKVVIVSCVCFRFVG
jgi:hypothetical protein